MNIAARTETAEQRRTIYASLTRRNRLVMLLRIGLPAIGAVILTGLLLQLYIGSLVPDFGFANITIDRDNLVVATPSYSGVGTDGTVYTVGADSAKAAIGNTDLIHLYGATFSLKQPTGASFAARADTASLRLSDQIVSVTGITSVEGSNGMSGTVRDAELEVATETMKSGGEVDFTFAGGSTLKADSMSYDGEGQRWNFNKVELYLTGTPGESELAAAALRPAADLTGSEAAP
jgi:lipopolysaccharide export system protein LptC